MDIARTMEAAERSAALWRQPEYRDRTVAAARAGRARVKAGEGYLYVAEMLGTDVVKLGFSLNPKNRVRKTWSFQFRGSTGPRLMAFTPYTFLQERALHRTLREHQIGSCGEFYPRSILTHEAIPEGLRGAA